MTLDNAPWIDPATINITFKCVVGDRDGDGAPDLSDVPYICGPSTGTWMTDWKTKRGRSQHTCNPYIGDKCNTVSVRTSETVNYIFAPVIGIKQGSTGSVSAASCRGACGAQPNPLDVVMVIDRTGSMTTADLANAKNAARSVLDFYDSSEHHVGVVALPYGRPTDKCNANDPQLYPQAAASFWSIAPLSSDYDRSDGTLNTSSQIVTAINCLKVSPTITVRVNGVVKTNAGHTNLGDPLDAAREMLLTQGRSDVPDIIIFMTDGEANQPDGLQPCNYLNNKASDREGRRSDDLHDRLRGRGRTLLAGHQRGLPQCVRQHEPRQGCHQFHRRRPRWMRDQREQGRGQLLLRVGERRPGAGVPASGRRDPRTLAVDRGPLTERSGHRRRPE